MIIPVSTLKDIAHKLQNNQVGIFPFDTLLGLTCRLAEAPIKRIQNIKNRDPNSPFITIIGHPDQLATLTGPLSEMQHKTMQKCWPGPVTLILPKHQELPPYIAPGYPNIAIRWADYGPLQILMTMVNEPIVSTSLNISGQPAITDPTQIPKQLLDQVDFCLAKPSLYQHASQILDLCTTPIKELRKGPANQPL
ncbi:MAG: hypothetical protein CL521_05535 [Actinobacteria bacterium]|nr:hypothetical protein [Actinomycetota bacterium]|tara:strand:+ start:318 stop:899 length:582 start_codon:yes stop_codon:yes gene_type:complete